MAEKRIKDIHGVDVKWGQLVTVFGVKDHQPFAMECRVHTPKSIPWGPEDYVEPEKEQFSLVHMDRSDDYMICDEYIDNVIDAVYGEVTEPSWSRIKVKL